MPLRARRGAMLLLLLGLFGPAVGALAEDAGVVAPPPDAVPPAQLEQAPPLPTIGENDGAGRTVVVIPIEGTIDLGLAPFVKRILRENEGAALVILDVDTLGGRVDAAIRIRDALLSAKVPTLAFVDRRAISAGALISLAADYIVFAAGGSMGAATPVQLEGGSAKPVEEKMVSYMRSEMRATAEAKKRNGDLAEAMVDADVVVPGLIDKGKLLTVTTDTALRVGLANAKLEDLNAILVATGLRSAEISRPQPNWAERVARFLTDPIVSGLLMSLGILGLLIEFSHPGFALPGIVGVVSLLLFFLGHWTVELAGWEEVLLFVLGLIALGVELFVLPGFGVMGVIGVGLIIASLAMALVGYDLSTSYSVGALGSAIGTVFLSLAITGVAMMAILRFLPRRSFGRWLVLETTLGRQHPAEVPGQEDWRAAPSRWGAYLGRTGVALTDLRLSGKARIGDEVVDVVSLNEYIARGTPVRVVEVEGVRIVVVRSEE